MRPNRQDPRDPSRSGFCGSAAPSAIGGSAHGLTCRLCLTPIRVKVFEVGECEIDGVALLYLVMERADGDLGGVLAERALTAIESA